MYSVTVEVEEEALSGLHLDDYIMKAFGRRMQYSP